MKVTNVKHYSIKILLSISLLLGALVTTANAQTPTVPTIDAGRAFKVAADHDGLNTTHYLLRLNGKQVADLPATTRVNGVVTFDVGALTPGTYELVAIARNESAAPFTNPSEAESAVYKFEAWATAPKPNPPAWRETVIRYADGRTWIESIVPVTDSPQVLHLQADGTIRVEG